MKTIIKISNDYYGELSNDNFKENINYLVNEIDVFCIIKNNGFNNIVNDERRYATHRSGYKNSIQIEAKGYAQSEWQTYILYYNENELKTNQERMYFSSLVKQLERTFTHKNDYCVEKFEQTVINGKKFNADPHDYTNFSIDNIEFPEKNDVLESYIEIYGNDFNEVIIEID